MVVIGDTCVRRIMIIRTIIRLPEALSVMGGMCVQSITAIRTIIRLPEALSFIVAMVMVVMGGMCVQSIMAIHTITRLGNSDCSPEAVHFKAPRLRLYPVPLTAREDTHTLWGIFIFSRKRIV